MKLLLIIALCMPMFSYSQEKQELRTIDKKIVCTTADNLSQAIANSSFKESPVWIAKDDTSSWAIVASQETGTWTLIQFDNNIGCIVGSGVGQATLVDKVK